MGRRVPNEHGSNRHKPIELHDADVLFIDDNYLAVNKAQGWPVHATRDPNRPHLEGAAQRWLATTNSSREASDLRVAHRLDVWTSGVVLIARNRIASRALSQQFEQRNVVKIYEAICVGQPDHQHGELKHYLSKERESGRDVMRPVRSGGKVAITRFRVLGYDDQWSLVELRPLTGRTHQLRVQTADDGWPIVGDDVYGTTNSGFSGQLLHARSLIFSDPISQAEIVIEAPAPEPFRSHAERLRLQKN